jgi:8-oxo-dGTP pyrophosphatase MutT (NUDIX family)
MEKKLKGINLDLKKIGGRFIELYEAEVTHVYSDGTRSESYRNEFIHRKGFDSVVAAVFCEENGENYILLRKQLRIPAFSRRKLKVPLPEGTKSLYLLEAVAGSLEPGDMDKKKILMRVAAEVFEEAGFVVKPKDIISLGAPFFTSPGQSSEKIFPFAAKVGKRENTAPPGDGSLLEKDVSEIKFYPFKRVISLINKGQIQDAKTEIVVLRLCMALGVLTFKSDAS